MNVAFLIPGFQGPAELLLILVVILLLFGTKRLPDLARAIGKSMSEFRKGRAEGLREDLRPSSDATKASAPQDADDEGKGSAEPPSDK